MDRVSSLLECPICCDFFQTAFETPCCHQLYCKTCIQDWSKNKCSCPSCRSKLESSRCSENIPIQRFVDQLPVPCPYRMSGCNANPARMELERHKSLCSFSPERLEEEKKRAAEELHKKKAAVEQKEQGWRAKMSSINPAEASLLKVQLMGELLAIARLLLDASQNEEAFRIGNKALALKSITKTNSEESTIEEAECLSLLAQYHASKADYAAALPLLESALNVANKLKSYEKMVDYTNTMGEIYSKQTKYELALSAYARSINLCKQHLGVTSLKVAETLNRIGLVAKKSSHYEKATQAYADALKLIGEPQNKEQERVWMEVAQNLADVYRKQEKYGQAKELYLLVKKRVEDVYGDNCPLMGEVCNALGMLAKKEGKYEEALTNYRTALKICKHFFGDSHPNMGMYQTNLGDIYRKKGDYKAAEAIYSTALTTLEKILGPDHLEVAEVLNSIGLVHKKRAEYDQAEVCYQRAISILTKTFGEKKHYKMGIYMNNLADIDRKRGKYDQALSLYKKALNAIETTLGHTHSEAAEIMHNMGLVYHQKGDYSEAVRLIRNAMDIIKKEFGDKHYKFGMFGNNLGLALAMLSQYKAAYTELKDALRVLMTCLGADHVEVADCYTNLGDVCMKLQVEGRESGKDKLNEAKKYYSEALRIVKLTFGEEQTKVKQLSSLLFICENFFDLVG